VGGLEVIKRKLLSLLSILLIPVMSASEQAKPAEGEDLAKAAQNPIASLISVPLQNNTAFGIGPFDRNQNAFLVPEEAKIMTFVVGRTASPISGTAAGTHRSGVSRRGLLRRTGPVTAFIRP
jgi:hypothetical protein